MDWELIWWVCVGIFALGSLIGNILPWNTCYDKNSKDPYRYCPKE